MLKIIVNGARGKMGQLACDVLANHHEFNLVAKTNREDALAECIAQTKADIVVDFTLAQVAFENANTIIQAGAHPVIGTTGLTPTEIQSLMGRCRELKRGGIIAPNFSLGIALMTRFSAQAAKYFSSVEIIEMHHPGKQDAPSGTAMATAEAIVKVSGEQEFKAAAHEAIPGSRGANYSGIPIHAVRMSGLLASQTVLFGGNGETFSLRHDTVSRDCYREGILLACKSVVTLNEMRFGLEALLN